MNRSVLSFVLMALFLFGAAPLLYANSNITTSKVISGTHYGNDGKSSIDINDNAQRNATDYANTMGHEVAHARLSRGKPGSDQAR